MTTTCSNQVPSRPRRSLNDTIAYLDRMIDGLSEAIPATISDTLKETVGVAISEGVRAALTEMFSNAEVLRLLRTTLLPDQPATAAVSARPSLLKALGHKLAGAVGAAGRWCRSALGRSADTLARCVGGVSHRLAALRQRLRSLWQRLQALQQFSRPLALALGVGGLAALAALVAPSWVAAVLSGVGGAGATLALQAGSWLCRNLSAFAVADH